MFYSNNLSLNKTYRKNRVEKSKIQKNKKKRFEALGKLTVPKKLSNGKDQCLNKTQEENQKIEKRN